MGAEEHDVRSSENPRPNKYEWDASASRSPHRKIELKPKLKMYENH